MATIIRVKIANGHKPQVDAIVEANPGTTPDQAAQQWVAQRYGDWITANLTEAFSFRNVGVAQFDVMFSSPDHARAFREAIGGQEVADGA
ncbi:hypothetical protein [Methylobacterium sp. Leaf89]|uniref:hypothetical protein n=1 Tax=Methylobacterium sp. Leaf89 TaxID=1736245 RepID=UPI000700755A|nr:hypothetical protein [Methylobacterium sp. Leaf89]KQO67248.1 hypothetical protein ASF18_11290 [Methylobacterium sp. Leaf89]